MKNNFINLLIGIIIVITASFCDNSSDNVLKNEKEIIIETIKESCLYNWKLEGNVKVPIILFKDKIFIEGVVNSSDTILLLFDCGAKGSFLSEYLCKNDSIIRENISKMIYFDIRTELVLCKSLKIGGFNIAPLYVNNYFPEEGYKRAIGIDNLKGILGINGFEHYNYQINFAEKFICFQNKTSDYKNVDGYRIKYKNNIATLPVKINVQDTVLVCDLMIDTGCDVPLIINKNKLELNNLIPSNCDVDSLQCDCISKYVIINEDTLYNVNYSIMFANSFSEVGSMHQIDGVIGIPMLKKYNIYFDNYNKETILNKIHATTSPETNASYR